MLPNRAFFDFIFITGQNCLELFTEYCFRWRFVDILWHLTGIWVMVNPLPEFQALFQHEQNIHECPEPSLTQVI
jgi:hypothetical protein